MRALRESEETPEIPLTSLIDVVFLLLIFFLVATNFVRKEIDQQVQLPRADGVKTDVARVPESLVVNVRADGVLVVNGRVMDEDGLRREVRAWRAARDVDGSRARAAIRGDGRVSYEAVMKVMGVCRREGVLEVDLPVLEEGDSAQP